MPSPTLDATALGFFTNVASGATATLTTTLTNDVIVIVCCAEVTSGSAATVSSVTATGLSFVQRSGFVANGSEQSGAQRLGLEVWWAPASSTFTGAITVTYGRTIDDASLVAFGVNGCNNISSPWDPNAGVPAEVVNSTTSASVPSATFSTSTADTFAFGACANGNSTLAFATAAGYTHINHEFNGGGTNFMYAWVDYKQYASTQSSASFTGNSGAIPDNIYLVDALTADAVGGASYAPPAFRRSFVPQIRASSW